MVKITYDIDIKPVMTLNPSGVFTKAAYSVINNPICKEIK
jgi:hypothetical protein